MKLLAHAALAVALTSLGYAHAAPPPPPPVQHTAAPGSQAHVQAVQDLLKAMQYEYALRGIAARTQFPNPAQRAALLARLKQMPAADIHRRLAPPMARLISAQTAQEMTRYYTTPHGKQQIHARYNSSAQLNAFGGAERISPAEQKERKRSAYIKASRELAEAEPAMQREGFKLIQQLNSAKR